MSKHNDPAFPFSFDLGLTTKWSPGLNKRELFAAIAMHGLVGSFTVSREEMATFTGITAVKYADALIVELEKESST